jgi:hypothetical protein
LTHEWFSSRVPATWAPISEQREGTPILEELDRARFDQETRDREREIALKEREVSLKESESQKSRWHDPLIVALVAAILALLGNIYSSVSNAHVAAKASTDNARIAAYASRRNAL